MKSFYSKLKTVITLFIWLQIICLSAYAQDYLPITSIDLGVKELELEVGESFTFDVTYEPAEPSFYTLTWTISDSSVISVDPASAAITALTPGEAVILAESLDGVSYDVCFVKVNGSQTKEPYELKAGSSFLSLSGTDRAKITSRRINRYLNYLEISNFSESTWAEAQQRFFEAEASINPGSDEEEFQHALDCGMENAEMLEHLHIIILRGTLGQILRFTENNPDLLSVYEKEVIFVDDPITEVMPEEENAKTFNLKGNADALSSFSTAHALGYTGSGSVIAVIDSGIDRNHEQFAGRVLMEYCAAHTDIPNGTGNKYYSVCSSVDSSAASQARAKSLFNHGSHVTGIAAGRDGVAPDAQIIAIQHSHEHVWQCTQADADKYACPDYSSSGNCCRNQILNSSLDSAYEYILDLSDAGTRIDAANMSYGGYIYNEGSIEHHGFESACDTLFASDKAVFQQMIDAQILPINSSGNNADKDGYVDNTVGYNACLSNTMAVGALANNSIPLIAIYSNHGPLVDITAPGTNIYSANYPSGYMYRQGTSMAAPMVSGAAALVKQAYPYNSGEEIKYFLLHTTQKTVNQRVPGTSFTNYSYDKPVLSFVNFEDHLLEYPMMSTSLTAMEVSKNVISMSFKRDMKATGYSFSVYDLTDQKTVIPTIDPPVHSGSKTTIKLHGTCLTDGHLFRIKVYKYHKIGGYQYKSDTVTTYGFPSSKVTNLTVSPGNMGVKLNSVGVAGGDGIKYVIYNTATRKVEGTYFVENSNPSTYISGWKNGTKYYAYARPYKYYDNRYILGPATGNVYFIPVPDPTGVSMYFANENTAVISVREDPSVTGIRVLYREAGGSMQNGCEAAASQCSITNLEQSSAYEFYVMRYIDNNGNKHYGEGAAIQYNPPMLSSIPKPDKTTLIVSGKKWIFTIENPSVEDGISVLYRINEGEFQQACEKAGNSCSATLTKDDNTYTFYIMQYKVVDGRKLYSPGVIIKNFFSAKSAYEADPAVNFVEVYEDVDREELARAIEGYMTEKDLMEMEVLRLLAPDMNYDYPESGDVDPEILEEELKEAASVNPVTIEETVMDKDFVTVETGDCPDELPGPEDKGFDFTPAYDTGLNIYYIGDTPKTTVPNFEP